MAAGRTSIFDVRVLRFSMPTVIGQYFCRSFCYRSRFNGHGELLGQGLSEVNSVAEMASTVSDVSNQRGAKNSFTSFLCLTDTKKVGIVANTRGRKLAFMCHAAIILGSEACLSRRDKHFPLLRNHHYRPALMRGI